MSTAEPVHRRARPATLVMKRALPLLVVAAGIVVSVVARPEDMEWSPDSVRDWLTEWPLAPLAYVLAMVLRPFLLIPSAVMMAAGGALFGVWEGTLLGAVGGALSALLTFWIVRSLGREAVEPRFGARLRRVDAYLRNRGAAWVAAYTAFPATPLTLAQIACGLSSIAAMHFVAATFLGLIPRTALLAWFGHALMEANWVRAGAALLLIVLAILIGWRVLRSAAPSIPDDGPPV